MTASPNRQPPDDDRARSVNGMRDLVNSSLVKEMDAGADPHLVALFQWCSRVAAAAAVAVGVEVLVGWTLNVAVTCPKPKGAASVFSDGGTIGGSGRSKVEETIKIVTDPCAKNK